ITVASFVKMVVVPLKAHNSNDQVALMLEQRFGIEGNVLINTMQFADVGYTEGQQAFINATATQATSGWSHIPMRELWQAGRVTKWSGVFALLAVLWIGYSLVAPNYLKSALTRYAFSFSDAPPAAASLLIMSPAENLTIAEYDKLDISLDVSAYLKGRDLAIYPAIRYKEGIGVLDSQATEAANVKMRPVVGNPNLYQYTFEAVRRSFSFRIFVGGTYTHSVQITVIPAAKIVESTFTVTPPAYVAMPAREQSGPPNAVKCLPATELGVRIKVDKDIESLSWEWPTGTVMFQDAGDKVWKASVVVGESGGNYDLVAVVENMPEPITLTSGSVQIKTDRKPVIRYVDTELSQVVLPGATLPLKFEGKDDYGMQEMTLTSRSVTAGSEPKVIRNWVFGDAPGDNSLIEKRVQLKIDASEFKPGSKYYIEVRGSDFCANTDDGFSDPLLLTVKNLDLKLDAGDDSDSKDVYAALDRAIQLQKIALEHTQSMLTKSDNTWLDMSRKRRDDKDVQKDLDSARAKILSNQTDVRTTLLGGVAKAKDPGVYMVARMLRIAEDWAVEANHRAFAAGRQRMAFGKVRRDNGYGPGTSFTLVKTQNIQFKEKSARYVGLVFDSSHGWASPASLEKLAIMTTNKTYMTTPVTVLSSSIEDTLGVIGIESTKKVAITKLPATLILDLGSEQIVSGLACLGQKADAKGQHASTRGVSVYLTTDKPPVLAVVALEQERSDGDFEYLKVVQTKIYNALLELKGKEFADLAKANDDELSALLDENLEEEGPSATAVANEIQEQLEELYEENDENDQLEKIITSKDADDLTEGDERDLSNLELDKEALTEELMDMVEDLARSEWDFATDAEIKITEVTLHQVSDALEDMELTASMSAEDDDKPVRDDSHNLETNDPALGAEELETALSDPDLGGGMETGQSEDGEDEGVPSEIGELPAELPSIIKELSKALADLGEPVPESGSELDDMAAPVGSPTGDNIDSAAAAGTMTEETPNPMAKSDGRAKEGRAGSADGQMAGDKLAPIPDNQVAMPPRMSDAASEKGQIMDEDNASATAVGLGKGTGTAIGFEKIGKLPKDAYKDLERMMGAADDDSNENNTGLMLALNKHHLPTTDLKVAMDLLAQAKSHKQGIAARQMVSAALEHMNAAEKSLATAIERQTKEMAERNANDAFDADTSVGMVPAGYDDMVSRYFKAVAEESAKRR
ncbi:MAG: hypothetical protein OSB41_09075, partial [Kiritimatiellae bacterium]|nr:hypothetical protein [Kiritimatiellia bacterium]